MSQLVCPDCGHRNPSDAASCERCNFPLSSGLAGPAGEAPGPHGETGPRSIDDAGAPPPGAGIGVAPNPPPALGGSAFSSALPPRPLRRPPRPRPMAQQSISLWLLFGTFAAVLLIYTAVKANLDRARTPVEGAQPNQQQRVDELRDRLAKDSTDASAHVELANVLYDTGNWSDAIVHYRAALRRDSSQASVLVDLGVCYYSLGDTRDAERCFEQALRHDPHQPVGLFNLGVVNERREKYDLALQFYHRALESSPPEEMKPVLVSAMQRVQQKTGRKPKPLPDGAR
jgi:tetratricopeptide repeat protein